MKKQIINSLSRLPFINSYFSGLATIFMLHRVHPFEDNKLLPNENMKVSPEFLEKFIVELKSKGYEFISLDRLYEILKNGEKVEKQIIFTLDDGYKDNYEIAYPIFKKYNIPFTVYITTSFPEKTAILWWHGLEDIIIENSEIILFDDSKYICKTEEEKIDTFLKIREIIISFKQEDFLEKLNELFVSYKIDWFLKYDELAMSWNEIKKLSEDEIVTIAGHTKNHYALNKLIKEDIIKEIVEANELIESKINKKIEHFAYPFGSSNEIEQREFDIVKSLGFKTVTTTRNGNIYPEHINYLECLPRFMLTEDYKIDNIGRIRRKKLVTI